MRSVLTTIMYALIGFVLGMVGLDYRDWRFYLILGVVVTIQLIEHFTN